MSDMKTRPTAGSVETIFAGVEDDRRRGDCRAVMARMPEPTGEENGLP